MATRKRRPVDLCRHFSAETGLLHASDAADARRVAERLEIPFYAINFEEEFGRIIHYFISEYTSGRTPNPCVVCNTWLKFGKLVDYADSVGAGKLPRGTTPGWCKRPTAASPCAGASIRARTSRMCCGESA